MEGVLDVIKTLSATLESHISSVQALACIPRPTLERLPDEIILDVLRLDDVGGCLSKPPRDLLVPDRDLRLKSLLRYSHICSRFRAIILSLHSLWYTMTLSLSLPVYVIETIARGGGNLGLTVSIDIGYDPDSKQFCTFTVIRGRSDKKLPVSSEAVLSALTKIYAYYERWENVELGVRDMHSAEYIQDKFCHADPISLRTLKAEGIGGRPGTCLYYEWTMPHLEELCWKIYEILPLATVPNLRICSLHQEEPKLGDIIAFLISTPSLTSLTLELQRDFRPEGPVEHQVAILPYLEQLDLRFGHSSVETIACLLAATLCPGLKHLSFRTYRHPAFLDLARRIQEGRYPLLNSVTLDIGWTNDQYEERVVYFEEDILRSLPSTIEKIKLKGMADLRSSRRADNVPPRTQALYSHLKELDLNECSSPEEEGFFANLSDVLGRLGVVLDHFQPAGKWGRTITEAGKRDAIATLQRAGVLVVPGSAA